MSSIVRRSGSKLLFFIKRALDPGATANQAKLYGKDVSGDTELFAQTTSGVYQLTPNVSSGRMLIPECWQQQDPPAAQAATAMACGASQLFDDWQAIRAGSLTGLNLRFNAVLTAGTATAVVTVNGAPTALTVTVAAPDSSGRATAAAGAIAFAAGDLIGVTLATSAGYLPVTLDVEAAVEIDT